ncbi:MAG: hypothetical protein ACI8RZ_007816 [Myxococcota bacterium]|jgi:hypothetical protein
MPRKTTRSRVILITGLVGFALATAGCPVTSNPPPPDTGDTGDTEDTGQTSNPPPKDSVD